MTSFISSLPSLPTSLKFLTDMIPFLTPHISPDSQFQEARKALSSVLQNAILPKLASSLRLLEVNPGNQEHIEYFTDVMEWSEWFDYDTLSAVLEGEFFPQWLDILYDWSHQPGVVLSEVYGWIEGWRSLFPASLLENHYVILQFNRAWDIINEVLEGGNHIDPSLYRQPITYRHVLQNRLIQEKTDRMRNVRIFDGFDVQKLRQEQRESSTMSLRDALDLWGEKCNVELKQIENRTHDGKKLYLFGIVQFFIDDNVAFVRTSGDEVKWEPKSMQEMLDLNNKMEEDPMDSSVYYKQQSVPVQNISSLTTEGARSLSQESRLELL